MRKIHGSGDVMPLIIDQLTQEAWLLCFDEFQVTDVADAMILQRLFTGMFKKGVVVVATSNRPPDELYKNGLNRELFVPFIETLKQRCTVHNMKSSKDYRLVGNHVASVYMTPVNAATEQKLDEIFAMLSHNEPAAPTTLTVFGRSLVVPRAARGVAKYTFSELCERPLGPNDYIAICRAFHTIIVSGIPLLSNDDRARVRRFITFVDEVYEHKVKLICTAAARPKEIYKPGGHGNNIKTPNMTEIAENNTPKSGTDVDHDQFDETFAFDRTVSRLIEMQSSEVRALFDVCVCVCRMNY
eukprot:GEZU01015977.1.p1 GENE.GEZU01015977.1~~GEZU01015977.1.p1  ORF type:complete len:299 (-),score=74.27 GEZU01015977.1:61-957(-)